MRKIHPLMALSLAALLVQPGLAGAAVPGERVELRWDTSSDQPASKLWIRNLSPQVAKTTVETASAQGSAVGSELLSVEAGKAVEVPAVSLGDAHQMRVRSDADLFIVQAPESFDLSGTEVEGPTIFRGGRTKRGTPPRVIRPDWARNLLAGGPTLAKGSTGSATVSSEKPDARVEVAVELLQADSSVRVRLLDAQGEEVTALVASASRPVRWRTTLGPVNGESRVEILVQRGEAHGTVAAIAPGVRNVERTPVAVSKSTPPGGSGYFNHTINWWHTSDLYYSVAGAPPSTSGTLWTLRNNGSWTSGANWIQTDANGNATKGPWTYANQSGDEDAWAYIEWANGTETNWSHHIWDKTAPSVSIDSPGGIPAPTSFYGSSSDGSYGAGFDANWADCQVNFYNRTTGLYWTPSAGSYTVSSNYDVPCTISGMPSRSVSWSVPWWDIPSSGAHTSGHCYRWKACLYDGGLWGCWDLYFCA